MHNLELKFREFISLLTTNNSTLLHEYISNQNTTFYNYMLQRLSCVNLNGSCFMSELNTNEIREILLIFYKLFNRFDKFKLLNLLEKLDTNKDEYNKLIIDELLEKDVQSFNIITLAKKNQCELKLIADTKKRKHSIVETGKKKLKEEQFNDSKLLEIITKLRKNLEKWSNEQPLPPEIKILKEVDSFKLEFVIKQLKLHQFEDLLIFQISKYFIDRQTSYQNCSIFVKYILLKKVKSLKQIASRFLFSALVSASKLHPKTIVDSLLLPLFGKKKDGKPIMGSSQSEVINRIVDQCLPEELILKLLKGIIFGGEEIIWTDYVVIIVKNILSRKICLQDEIITQLLLCLEQNANVFTNSVKFTTLISTLISRYGKQVRKHVDLIQQILSTNKTFMKKTCQNLLESL